MVYTTRSGYEWLLEQKVQWDANESWLWLWHMNIPEKVKGLIWLCLHNAIPTASFRSSRNLTITDICPRCNEAPETTEHCLRFCIKVQSIWKRLEVGMSRRDAFLEFRAWLWVNFRATEAIFVAGLWWIWRDRNKDIFNPNDSWSIEKVIMLARHLAAEYGVVKCINQVSSHPSLIDSWCPPPLHVVKLNCDANLFEQKYLACFGCILRNDSGKWLSGCSASIPFGGVFVWPEIVEIMRLFFETDCLEAYLLITKDFAEMRRDYNDLLLKIAEMMQRNWIVHVHLIQKTTNTTADLLARTAAHHSLSYIKYLVPSFVVQEIIRKEMFSPT
ncbi:uncharacterized protein LOC107646634 [Arachis ipaensis]|uniref:uncharacterized protein LOC107646634 n=1 Tax=Arachis ipaensis TaxID=130454 RepID=UPI0007AF3327|nr:uncharacterized protein LOC107646634 [Arachis ipaensis]XP_025627888.1 uncharacterized protein LOC112721013 [Arachis hypogaea]